jgi:hypothetical protein
LPRRRDRIEVDTDLPHAVFRLVNKAVAGPSRQPLHLLLALLIPLGGLSEFEVRHRHEEGGARHRHGHAEGHRHDHDGVAGRGHHHPHRHDGSGEDPPDQGSPGVARAEDGHSHRFWLGDFFGANSSDRGEGPAGDGDGTDADPIEFARLQDHQPGGQANALLLSLAGALPCSPVAPQAAEAGHISSHGRRNRGTSPPLCDRARHERSGVLLT